MCIARHAANKTLSKSNSKRLTLMENDGCLFRAFAAAAEGTSRSRNKNPFAFLLRAFCAIIEAHTRHTRYYVRYNSIKGKSSSSDAVIVIS
jgi:hypothetical protein